MNAEQARLFFGRFPRLIAGLLLLGFACALQVQANLGYSAWTVLDHGLTNYLPLTLGNASITTSAAVILLDLLAGERIGVGMVLNMFMVGKLIDFFTLSGLIPRMPGLFGADGAFSPSGAALSVGVLLVSIVLMSFAGCLYMGAGLGAGPRDTLMVAAMKLTGRNVALCRNTLELMAVGVGWLLGGSVGVGTLAVALLGGPCMQVAARVLRFDAKATRHVSIDMLPGLFSGKLLLTDPKKAPATGRETPPSVDAEISPAAPQAPASGQEG